MITVITNFKLPKPITKEEARSIFLSTAPKYQNVAGLIRKYYVLAEDGCSVGGVYLWQSRVEAEALFTESWKLVVRETYGVIPSVSYFDSPVVVDNLASEIISD